MATATELPKDVLTDILKKFPVKSICRFRCVCKSWQSLINSRSFIEAHLDYVTNVYNMIVDKSGCKSAIFYFKPDFRRTTSSFEYQKVCQNVKDQDRVTITHDVLLHCPPELRNPGCEIMACCDGILCVRSQISIVLWNPSVHDYVVLPPPSVSFGCAEVIGIGYDPIIDDYKVLRAPSKMGVITRKSHCSVEVLALKSKSWKTVILDEFPYEVICSQYPTFTDSGIHWFALRPGTQDRMILCFDVVHEKFAEVPQSPRSSCHSRIYGLRTWGRNLCVVDFKDGRFEYSLMKKYGVRESWIDILDPRYSKYVFPCYLKRVDTHSQLKYKSDLHDYHSQMNYKLLCWNSLKDENGEFLKKDDREIYIALEKRKHVIARDETFEQVSICDPCNFSSRIPYVESLVSLSAN